MQTIMDGDSITVMLLEHVLLLGTITCSILIYIGVTICVCIACRFSIKSHTTITSYKHPEGSGRRSLDVLGVLRMGFKCLSKDIVTQG